MPFCDKAYHPAAAHPCLFPRILPGHKRKREHKNDYILPFWNWYLVRDFSGFPPATKARVVETDCIDDDELATFSSLLIRHTADLAPMPKRQRRGKGKGVRFLKTSDPAVPNEVGVEEDLAITTATYLRSKAPRGGWINGEGPSQVDNEKMGMTTYEEGGQLKRKESLFLASDYGEIVELEKTAGEQARTLLGEPWLSAERLRAELVQGADGELWGKGSKGASRFDE